DDARALGELGGHFGLEPEPVVLEDEVLDYVASERLVARLHVREVEICECIRQRGQNAIAEAVPEVQHSMFSTKKPGPENDIRFAVLDRRDERGVVTRVVLEISVLDDDDVAGCMLEAQAERRTLAPVHGLDEQSKMWLVGLGQSPEDVRRSIRRRIVYDDDL